MEGDMPSFSHPQLPSSSPLPTGLYDQPPWILSFCFPSAPLVMLTKLFFFYKHNETFY